MGDKVIPVRVAVRIRPLSEKETDEGCQSVVEVVPGRQQIYLKSVDKAFTYDYAFDADSDQKSVYESANVYKMIENLFDGYNATVLAYGQTGSGKTHTMGTSFRRNLTAPELAGIIPRAVGDIFKVINDRSIDIDVSVKVSFVELYREQLYDLLSSTSSRKEDCVCDLREDPLRGVIVPGLTEIEVSSLQETMHQLEMGSLKRVTAATAMNNTSSRSHAIFSLILTISSKDDSEKVTESKFHLVDLAGSERAKKTKAEGDRKKEGIAINQGLLALGNVIAALGEENPSGKISHIPYRNSKLTRMLQDSLGGNSYTLMVSCVSPADSNLEETISTLRYSDRARKIKNKPIVNLNGSDAVMNKLRLENQELKMQLQKLSGGSATSAVTETEMKILRQNNQRLREENKRLTNALMGSQNELAHIHEKVLLHESSNEKLKTRMKEVVAELASLGEKDSKVASIHKRVVELVEMQSDFEKTMVEHDVTRAEMRDDTSDDLNEDSVGDSNDDNEDDDDGYSAHALKSNAISKQLLNVNNLLAQKEKLASAMMANDEQLQAMKQTYEKTLANLESEISTLQKERDELMQLHKNAAHDPKSKIAEQRRKRIQELEHKLQDLQKKVVEQQKAIKMNEKNAAQVKKLNEEILQLKQAKVKLIRQFKDDSEKLRAYKQQKEREVMRLKQNERKQQAMMAKMESLHNKQQNVLRRKMEEAMMINKRLQEIVDKQKNARPQLGKGGLAGAGERVRSWLNEELDVVVSVKEAMRSRENLVNDRKVIMKDINKIKKDMRDTMSKEDMAETQKKMESLQADLDLRNAQIAQLQKQISDLEQDAPSKARFDHLKTISEAKLALEHAFDKTVEQSLMNSQLKSEYEEMRQLYEEAVKNTNNLEREISGLKHEHQNQFLRMTREHEEKVLFLLSKLSNASENERYRIQEEELKKYSKLNEELMKMSEENEKLRERQMEFETNNKETTSKRKSTGKQRRRSERYTPEEFFEDESESEVSEDEVSEAYDDPDWVKTPLYKRIRKLRESTFVGTKGRKRKTSFNGSKSDTTVDEGEEVVPSKRFSGNSTSNGCRCRTGCNSKRCQCRKSGPVCNDDCKCDPKLCQNREDHVSREPLVEQDTNDTANTASLLNATFSTTSLLAPPNENVRKSKSPFKSPSPSKTNMKKHVFKSPLLDNNSSDDEDDKPTNKTYFTSPFGHDDKDGSYEKPRIRV